MFIPEMWQHGPAVLMLMVVASLVVGWKVSK
jgi:hypothetical protein